MAENKKTMRHESALKAHRKSLQRRAQNTSVKNRVRTLTKNVLTAIAEKNADKAQAEFKQAQAAWQKAAKNGVFHPNAAARKISRLANRIQSISKS